MSMLSWLFPQDGNGFAIPVAPGAGTIQNVDFNGAVQSAAFGAGVKLVRLVSTQDCYVLFGSNPTATTSNGFLLKAGVPEWRSTSSGQKLSAIEVSTAGRLNIQEF